jgi:hypothetical protein
VISSGVAGHFINCICCESQKQKYSSYHVRKRDRHPRLSKETVHNDELLSSLQLVLFEVKDEEDVP